MPYLPLDLFDVIAGWQALTPVLGPSAQIALTIDSVGYPGAATAASLRVQIDAAPVGHRLRRALPAQDLTGFGRLVFWFRSDQALAGLTTDLLQMRLRLGSFAMPLDAVGNLWGRYLVGQKGAEWNYVTVSLADLPAAIRNAVTQIEFVVTASDGAAHQLWLDGLLAAAPQMTVDVDTALMQQLDGVLLINALPVAARMAPAAAALPFIRATQYLARRARDRDPIGLRRQERDNLGLLTWPEPEAWDLSYRFDAVSASRAEMAAMLDFLGARFERRWLPVGNRAFRIEKADMAVEDDEALPVPPMRYVVGAWSETGSPVREMPVTSQAMHLDTQPAGG